MEVSRRRKRARDDAMSDGETQQKKRKGEKTTNKVQGGPEPDPTTTKVGTKEDRMTQKKHDSKQNKGKTAIGQFKGDSKPDPNTTKVGTNEDRMTQNKHNTKPPKRGNKATSKVKGNSKPAPNTTKVGTKDEHITMAQQKGPRVTDKVKGSSKSDLDTTKVGTKGDRRTQSKQDPKTRKILDLKKSKMPDPKKSKMPYPNTRKILDPKKSKMPDPKKQKIMPDPNTQEIPDPKTQSRPDPKPTRLRYKKRVDIRHKQGDTGICTITGMTLMNSDTMALTDMGNSSVKIIDLTSNKVTAYLKLETIPWDLTCLDPNTLVITCDNSLVFLNYSNDKLELTKRVTVEPGCRGIVCRQGKLFVTFCGVNPPVKVLNIDGNVIQTLSDATHIKGRYLYNNPEYITLGNDGSTLYVSDSGHNTVTCLDMDGTVCHTYTHEDLRYPSGLTVDGNGDVLVAGWRSLNIHQISPSSASIHVVLEKKDKLIRSPCTVLYNTTTDTLYVGCFFSNEMSVFKLKLV